MHPASMAWRCASPPLPKLAIRFCAPRWPVSCSSSSSARSFSRSPSVSCPVPTDEGAGSPSHQAIQSTDPRCCRCRSRSREDQCSRRAGQRLDQGGHAVHVLAIPLDVALLVVVVPVSRTPLKLASLVLGCCALPYPKPPVLKHPLRHTLAFLDCRYMMWWPYMYMWGFPYMMWW